MLWDSQIYYLKINIFTLTKLNFVKRFIKSVTTVTRYKYFIFKLINNIKWLKPMHNVLLMFMYRKLCYC